MADHPLGTCTIGKIGLSGQVVRGKSSAKRKLEGIETVTTIRKGRVRWVAKKDVVAEARFIAKLFAHRFIVILSRLRLLNTGPSAARNGQYLAGDPAHIIRSKENHR